MFKAVPRIHKGEVIIRVRELCVKPLRKPEDGIRFHRHSRIVLNDIVAYIVSTVFRNVIFCQEGA